MNRDQNSIIRDIMDGDITNEESYYRRRYYSEEELIKARRYRKFQMIFSIIFLIIAGIIYLFTYKSKVEDPIADLKKTVMVMHLGLMLIVLIASFIINIFSKDINTYLIKTYLLLAVSIIVFLAFCGIKFYMNSTYTKEKFEEIYYEEYSDEKIDIPITSLVDVNDLKIRSEKDFFVEENIKVYRLYDIKTYGLLILNLALVILFIYQTRKISELKEKKDRVAKDDIVLFDEEENVKI